MYNALKNKLFSNPANKWLLISFAGFVLCFTSLGMHVFGNGNQSGAALPDRVMRQVFGFSPYYFFKNTPPGKLSLKLDSSKFLGNALSFDLIDSKNRAITVSEKALPDGYNGTKNQGDMAFETSEGNALLGSAKGGRVTGTLTTKDKTLIALDAPDSVNRDTLEQVLRSFTPADKPALVK